MVWHALVLMSMLTKLKIFIFGYLINNLTFKNVIALAKRLKLIDWQLKSDLLVQIIGPVKAQMKTY